MNEFFKRGKEGATHIIDLVIILWPVFLLWLLVFGSMELLGYVGEKYVDPPNPPHIVQFK